MIIAKKNAAYYLSFPAIDSTTPASYKSGISPVDTAYYKDGAGAWSSLAITDTATEIGATGVYEIDLTAAEMNHDKVIVKFSVSGMADDAYQFDLRAKLTDDLNDVAATDIVSAGAITTLTGAVVNVDTVDTTTTNTDMVTEPPTAAAVVNEWETQSQADPTGFHINQMEVNGTAQTANDNGADINTILVDVTGLNGDAMRGTNSAALASVCTEARLAELDGANLPADIAAVPTAVENRTELDSNSTQLALIVADTSELQGDWTNTGRLDTILDAVKAVTDNLPNSGALTDLSTAAALATVDTVVAAIKVVTDALTAVSAAKLALSAGTIVSGAAATGTLSTTQMTTGLTEATDDHYNGRIIIWTSGVLQNQATDITDYTGATKMLTFTAVTEAPSDGNTFVIV